MKEKITNALKTKYSNLGFSEKALDGVADYLSKTVSDESQIETVIGGVESLLKVFQSDADRVRTEAAALKTKIASLEKAPAIGGEQEKNNAPALSDKDLDAKMQEWFERRVKPIKEELDAYKSKEAASARQNFIVTKAKELGIPEYRIREGFAIDADADDKSIGDYLAGVKTNLVAAGLEGKSSGFPLSTPEAQGKELAKSWAQNLPDKE